MIYHCMMRNMCLRVQGLRFHASAAGDVGLIHGRGSFSCRPIRLRKEREREREAQVLLGPTGVSAPPPPGRGPGLSAPRSVRPCLQLHSLLWPDFEFQPEGISSPFCFVCWARLSGCVLFRPLETTELGAASARSSSLLHCVGRLPPSARLSCFGC